MAHYSKITLAQANEIIDQYDLGQITSLEGQGHGISNTNYQAVLDSGQRILLKISNDKSYQQLLDEQKILLYLQSQQFPLSLVPYLNKDSRPVYQTPDFTGVIYPFIAGEVSPISAGLCQQIGKALAQLHLVPASDEIRHHSQVGFGLPQILDYLCHPLCPQDFKEAFEQVFSKSLIQKMLNTTFAQGLIHGDLYYDNVMSQNGKILKLLDFEQAGRGNFILDLGISISGSCLVAGELDTDLINIYRQSYESVRPLNSIENDFFHQAILMGLFSISLWRIKRFYTGKIDPQKKESYKELLQRALHYHQVLQL